MPNSSKNKTKALKQPTIKTKLNNTERLLDILTRLNDGECLSREGLMIDYDVSQRTIQRDMNLLSTLPFAKTGKEYQLERQVKGKLNKDDIQRLINFTNVQNLLPEFDRQFFQKQLIDNILVKGMSYENIEAYQAEFDLLTQAIQAHKVIEFDYIKVKDKHKVTAEANYQPISNHYRVEPYRLLNKRGVWYLVGVKLAKNQQPNAIQLEKGAFCFTQMSHINMTIHRFTPDDEVTRAIHETDSIYYKDLHTEVVLQVSAEVAGYFERRKLLPNQETIRKLEDGNLLLACKNVSSKEIFPQVKAWIPHIRIISPIELQGQMESELWRYLRS